MFFSLAVILLLGMLAGWVCRKLRLPALLGMLLVGMLIGPYALGLIDASILNISAELRKIALIIILARGAFAEYRRSQACGTPGNFDVFCAGLF